MLWLDIIEKHFLGKISIYLDSSTAVLFAWLDIKLGITTSHGVWKTNCECWISTSCRYTKLYCFEIIRLIAYALSQDNSVSWSNSALTISILISIYIYEISILLEYTWFISSSPSIAADIIFH